MIIFDTRFTMDTLVYETNSGTKLQLKPGVGVAVTTSGCAGKGVDGCTHTGELENVGFFGVTVSNIHGTCVTIPHEDIQDIESYDFQKDVANEVFEDLDD